MPNYDPQTDELVTLYKKAIAKLLAELERFDITDYSRKNTQELLKSIGAIISQLDEGSAEWVEENIPKAVASGTAEALVALGIFATFSQALPAVKLSPINKALISAVVLDTNADLLAVTQNVSRRVKATVRQVVAESMRENLAQGINGRQSMNRTIKTGLQQKLGKSLNTAIVDAGGRRWDPAVYVDMVSRTKMMRAHIDSTINEAVDRDVYYGVISSHGAKDACRNWEGRVVKLIESAPGDYPYVGNLVGSREIWHPRCRHTVSPIRIPDRV